ncbi:MAG: hypothetical protein ABL891_22995 [Burkholderiales bacterium]
MREIRRPGKQAFWGIGPRLGYLPLQNPHGAELKVFKAFYLAFKWQRRTLKIRLRAIWGRRAGVNVPADQANGGNGKPHTPANRRVTLATVAQRLHLRPRSGIAGAVSLAVRLVLCLAKINQSLLDGVQFTPKKPLSIASRVKVAHEMKSRLTLLRQQRPHQFKFFNRVHICLPIAGIINGC